MEEGAKSGDFENVKAQFGYCGIWCASCVVGNGTLSGLTKRYRELLDVYGVLEWGPDDFDRSAFLKGLESIQGTPACAGCRRHGGRDNCEIRTCAVSKGIDECSQCDTIATCKYSEILHRMRSGALAAGLFVKAEYGDKEELLDSWMPELRNRWPCRILFMDDQ